MVIPTLQMGVYGITLDATHISRIFTHLTAPDSSINSNRRTAGHQFTLTLCSPYLNLQPRLQNAISRLLDAGGRVHVVTGAPSANGFHNSAGTRARVCVFMR